MNTEIKSFDLSEHWNVETTLVSVYGFTITNAAINKKCFEIYKPPYQKCDYF